MSRGKLRKGRVWKGALLGACLLGWGMTVSAFVPESVSLKGEGNKVEVLMSPVEKETVSLQLSMEVQVTKGASAASVSFEFDQGLPGDVKQYRYQQETGTLTLYISGDGAESFPEGEDFALGRVVLNSESGEPAEATVRVKTDSLKVVNRGYDMQTRDEIYAPFEGKAVAGSVQETPEEPAEQKPQPDAPSGVEEPSDEEEDSGNPGTHTSSGDSLNGSGSSEEGGPIPEQTDRPNVGIRVGAGQKTAGAGNPAAPLLPDTETGSEEVQEKPDTDKEAAADIEDQSEEDEEPKTRTRDQSAEETVDALTFWGIVAALCAGAAVVLLMLLEYRRKEAKRRRKKKKKVKK